MTRNATRISALVIVLAATLASPPAVVAQEEVVGDASRLAEMAEKEARDRHYDKAVELYDKAFERSGDPAFLYNISILYLLRLDRPDLAWEYASRFAQSAKTESEKKDASELIGNAEQKLSATHGRPVVTATPGDAEIWLDRRDPESRIRRTASWVKAGDHTVLARAEGHDPVEMPVEVKAGATSEVTVSLKPRQASLRVESAAAGTMVTVDGVSLGPAPAERLVDHGSHDVKAEAPGGLVFSERVEVKPGQKLTIQARFKGMEAVRKAPRATNTRAILTWVAIGAGSALVAGGSVCYGVAYSKDKAAAGLKVKDYDDYAAYKSAFESRKSKARNLSYAAYGLWGAGAAGVATGLVLYFTSGSSKAAVVPSGPGGPGVSALVRW